MTKILRFFYSLIVLKMPYTLDDKGMVAIITPNKPEQYLTNKENDAVHSLMEHFSGRGYHVIVR